ncbi:MAG: hypothetical protein BYD32DRAFT_457290 [Podila humilis]|nr:MAG: hypothetical protein BYD32DRAFT_457290 [Podila humilis]
MSTQDKKPAPLDPFGKEVCFLFLKYGKCRYGKKCKKSHILPDKDASVMQKLVEPTVESPTLSKLGPAIAFAFQKPTSIRPPARNSQPKPVQIPSKRPLETDMDTHKAPTMLDLIPATDISSRPTQNKDITRPKAKKAPKPVSKCLLAALFKTSTKLDSEKRALGKPIKTNTTDIAGKKVENWYVSNRARLDFKTRRLMVLAKSTTPRQAMQLKAMRKHHWECGEEVKEGLRRHRPAAYSLKITRDRIDWYKVTPYVTLMIQAAFDMDINHRHLPVIGSTLCAFLQYKNMGADKCEDLLVSWGLNAINARRFTAHLWGEVMVPAAGETNIYRTKGTGFRVRHFEHRNDYKILQERLTTLNQKLTQSTGTIISAIK